MDQTAKNKFLPRNRFDSPSVNYAPGKSLTKKPSGLSHFGVGRTQAVKIFNAPHPSDRNQPGISPLDEHFLLWISS
jgi:hypothetical protein